MEKPKVIVGMATYNRYELLKRSIDSALGQDYPNVQVAVFDNASTDNTPNIIKEYPAVKYFRADTKLTIVAAKNVLMSQDDYDYFIGLDDDAWLLDKGVIGEAVKFMENNKQVGALGLDILSPQNKESLFTKKAPFECAEFIGCGCVLRYSALKKVNFYTDTVSYYGGEEQDLSLKLLNENYSVFAYPGLFVWHEMTILGRDTLNQWRSQTCNGFAILLTYYPIPFLLVLLPYRLIRLFIFSVQKKIVSKYIKGVTDFFRSLGRLIKNRKPLKYATIIHYHKLLRSNK